jgi:hypothetical protein
VCAGDITRLGFIVNSGNVSGGALIYKPQRKQSHESTEINKGVSNVVHLLVIWRTSELKKLYADALLVKHKETFILNKDNLNKLYHKNIDQPRILYESATETWSLDDNVALMTTFEIMNNDYILNITVSEVERDNNTRMPVHVDLGR